MEFGLKEAVMIVCRKSVRDIMGKSFFGIEEAKKCFGISPTHNQLDILSEIPFSEETLLESRNTHILAAVFPLSILEICEKVNFRLFCGPVWYDEDPFALEQGGTSWQLVRKSPVDNSASRDWEEQLALIGENDEVPTARVMVYVIIGHYLAAKSHLFRFAFARTSSVDSESDHVGVGNFDHRGLDIDVCWDTTRDDRVSISSVRKPENLRD